MYIMGSLLDFGDIHKTVFSTVLGQGGTWIQMLHELQGRRPLELQDKQCKVTLRANPCIERGEW